MRPSFAPRSLPLSFAWQSSTSIMIHCSRSTALALVVAAAAVLFTHPADALSCWNNQQLLLKGGSSMYYYLTTCQSNVNSFTANYTVRAIDDDKYIMSWGSQLCGTGASDNSYYAYSSKRITDMNVHTLNIPNGGSSWSSFYPKIRVQCDNTILYDCNLTGSWCLGWNSLEAQEQDMNEEVEVHWAYVDAEGRLLDKGILSREDGL